MAALLLGLLLVLMRRWSLQGDRRNHLATSAGALGGMLLGLVLPIAQRGAEPATRPAEPYREFITPTELQDAPLDVPPPKFVTLSQRSGSLRVQFGKVNVNVEPLLQFTSRSPDRCWTVLAPRRFRVSPPYEFLGWRRSGDVATLYYANGGPASLSVREATTHAVRIEAQAALAKPLYSHLNSFCRLEVWGHERLSVTFSPCGDRRIEVTYSQYPAGRPMRFAYLDAAGTFHVVEANSGEKGPFRELARGPLPRDEGLAITLHDGDEPVGRVTLADFAAQASTQTSPTAGWGVPENAIEFALTADRPGSAATFWITLAGTSVGRGWDSVGHAAGVYRNRIEFLPLSKE